MFFIFGIFDFWAFLGSVFAFFVCIVVFFFVNLWLFCGLRGFVVCGCFVVVVVLWSLVVFLWSSLFCGR